MDWLKWLQQKLVPRTGRIIREDGTAVNADAIPQYTSNTHNHCSGSPGTRTARST